MSFILLQSIPIWKAILYDTVTLPFPLLLLLPQQIIHNEKEKRIKDMSKTKKKKQQRITDAVTHPAMTCASAPGIATASHLPMPSLYASLFCEAALFPLIFAFPNTSLQAAMLNLSGSSASISLPARCGQRGSPANRRQEGSLLRRAANGLLPRCRCTCGIRHPPSVRPHEPRGKLAGFPCFAISPGLTLTEKQGVYH